MVPTFIPTFNKQLSMITPFLFFADLHGKYEFPDIDMIITGIAPFLYNAEWDIYTSLS